MKSSVLSALGQRTAEPAVLWLIRLAVEHPDVISLAAGLTDPESLPVKETRLALAKVLGSAKTGRAALQYGALTGDAELRRLTAERVQSQDAPSSDSESAYSPDRFLITHGSSQLLYLVTEALCDPGDIVLLEDPSYYVFLGVMQSLGVRGRGIPLESDGLAVPRLEQVLAELQRKGELPRVKFLYVISYFQNPTGTTTGFAKKVAALELLRHYERAAGHPIYLLEDAAYRDLQFHGERTRSALTLKGHQNRVIYTGTYSKPFSTGVRLGYGRLPEPLFSVVQRLKGNHDFGTANLLQQLMLQVLRAGRFEAHVAALRRRYARKAEVMVGAIQERFPAAVRWHEPHGGLYVWARLPASLSAGVKSAVFRSALAQKVSYVPGEVCYAADPTRQRPQNEMRLSFGSASEAEIREGIARLGKVLQRFLAE